MVQYPMARPIPNVPNPNGLMELPKTSRTEVAEVVEEEVVDAEARRRKASGHYRPFPFIHFLLAARVGPLLSKLIICVDVASRFVGMHEDHCCCF